MKGQLDKLKGLLLALALLFAGFLVAYFKFFNVLQPPQDYNYEAGQQVSVTPQVENVRLTINFGNNSVISNSEPFTQNMTPYLLLRKTAAKNGFLVKDQTFSEGLFVTSIDGVEADEGFFWGYYINGQMGSVASNKFQLSPGDSVEWRYEEIQ